MAGFVALVAWTLVACGSGAPTVTAPTGATQTGVAGEVTVFAAASLTESFTQIGKDFEAANPGSKVTFNFAGSSALATQINAGRPRGRVRGGQPGHDEDGHRRG